MTDNLDSLRSSGLVILNPASGTDREQGSTLIVVGVPRSGTSMVASTLRALGVFMGDRIDSAVHEDIDMAHALESRNADRLRNLADARNDKHPVWGFKRPGAYVRIQRYLKYFRRPRFIVTFRDPVAIAHRNEIAMRSGFLGNLNRATQQSAALGRFVSSVKEPILLVSYEKALQNPEAFVRCLSDFCGLAPDEPTLDSARSNIQNGPEAYLRNARLVFEGRFGGIRGGSARGWVRLRGQTTPLSVEIRKGEKIVGRGLANLHRPDLAGKGRGTAECGFCISIRDKAIRSEDTTAHVTGYDYEVPRSRLASQVRGPNINDNRGKPS